MFVCFLPSFPQIKLPGADVRFRRIFASASLRTGIRYSILGIPNNFYDCSRKGIDSLNRVFYSACRKTSLCNATFPGRAGEANFTGVIWERKRPTARRAKAPRSAPGTWVHRCPTCATARRNTVATVPELSSARSYGVSDRFRKPTICPVTALTSMGRVCR
jgi:hypothetical protein